MIEFDEAWSKAQKAAMEWDPMSTNRDPQFIATARNYYCYGYAAGLLALKRSSNPTPGAT